MKISACVLALVGLTVMAAGCGKKPPRRPPPVAPATPPPAPPPTATAEEQAAVDEYTRLRGMSAEEVDRLGMLHEIHFDYDRSDIRADARPVLTRNADVLRRLDFLVVTVEGHCDERGTVEYNLALGERRAKAAREYLISLGVPGDRLRMVSYGKEAPLCAEPNEACWSRNRRAASRVTGKVAGG